LRNIHTKIRITSRKLDVFQESHRLTLAATKP
jgi:hypothetical protein